MTRGGNKTENRDPERKCIATGESQPKAGLIRFVVGPDAQVVPDLAGKLPGRGLWVSADLDALELAVRKNLFSRAARARVQVPADLVAMVTALLADRVVNSLSLARKAGQAIAGFEKVKALLVADDAVALFQASDGSEAMKRKLRPPKGANSYSDCLTAQELGVAFGRDTVIHAALTAGGLADLCVAEASRLEGLRKNGAPIRGALRTVSA